MLFLRAGRKGGKGWFQYRTLHCWLGRGGISVTKELAFAVRGVCRNSLEHLGTCIQENFPCYTGKKGLLVNSSH